MNNTRNYSVDVFRYISALLVVMIHTNFYGNFANTFKIFFSDVLVRIAVPFFFVMSSFFYFKKLEHDKSIFLRYIFSLIKIYLIWTMIYGIVDFAIWGYKSPVYFVEILIMKFFTIGSRYHLWFFPALIISICIITALYKVGLKKMIIPIGIIAYAIGCLGNPYYSIGKNVPILGNLFQIEAFYTVGKIIYMGLPFVVCGYAINLLMQKPIYERISEHVESLCVIGYIFWIAECCMIHLAGLEKNMEITVGTLICTVFVVIFLFKHPGERFRSKSKLCYTMANFTYYAHPLFIMLYLSLIKIDSSLLQYIVVVLGTSLTGFIIYKVDNKYLNKLIR